MCTTCGCSNHVHHHHDERLRPSRRINLEKDILAKNQGYADANRQWLQQRSIAAFNLVSSPGSGKTSLLTATIQALAADCTIGVIEGDQQTDHDARRIQAAGAQAVQINTGKGCHLDAHVVGHAMHDLNLPENALLFIENVGNLVCPAAFDLGEQAKVVVLSVTEGDDKPLKYPDMFRAARLMVINKIDLLPYVAFDVAKTIEYARRIHPDIEVLQVSATTGEGMAQWFQWLGNMRLTV